MIRKTWKLRLFILLFGLCAVPPAVAEMVPTPDIRRIESYLNGLRTIEARFVQNNPNGSYAVGKLYVQKPGKLRFEYDPPVPLLLIADGSWLFQVDKELKQVSQYPLFDTPAQFLLNERIVFGKEFGVINFQRHAKTVRIEVVDNRNPDLGTITMTFAEEPLELRNWVVTDSQGLRTVLSLVNARFDGKLDSELFDFVDPFTEPHE